MLKKPLLVALGAIMSLAACEEAGQFGETGLPEGVLNAITTEAQRSICLDAGNEVMRLDGPDLDGFGTDFCVEPGQAFWNEVDQTLGSDCDELDAAIHPGAAEACDGVDQDCDGVIDDGAPGTSTWFRDADGDGRGLLGTTTVACSQPTGYVLDSSDCLDTNAAIHSGAAEACNGVDDDCDGSVDESGGNWHRDADSDTYGDLNVKNTACVQPSGFVANSTDCNDGSTAIRPGATETCDGVDQDCDGSVDDGLTTTTIYRDADGDTYGLTSSAVTACATTPGFTAVSGDCNDGNAAIRPGATEVCNTVDDDCDGSIDEGGTTWYRDADGDTFGLTSSAVTACTAPAGFVATGGDCNDGSTAIRPNAAEVCDGLDNDCDNSVDEGASNVSWYRDGDNDGHGAGQAVMACAQPSGGYVPNSADCNDASPAIKPGASEACDGLDNDCDGELDEGLSTTAYYRDGDSDTYGNRNGAAQLLCKAPTYSHSQNNQDCNDTNSAVRPNATEVVNGRDDDCDGQIDEAAAACPTGQSLVSGTYTAPTGATIDASGIYGSNTGSGVNRFGSVGYGAIQVLTGSPAGMTVNVTGNVLTFSSSVCTTDSDTWRMSVKIGASAWSCSGQNTTSGTWVVREDGVQISTAPALNGLGGCDQAW